MPYTHVNHYYLYCDAFMTNVAFFSLTCCWWWVVLKFFSSFSITIAELWWMRKRPKHTIIIFGKHTHIKFVHGWCAGMNFVRSTWTHDGSSIYSTQRYRITAETKKIHTHTHTKNKNKNWTEENTKNVCTKKGIALDCTRE